MHGRDAFWMPASALECFDVIVQCPGSFYNHAVMPIARGRQFLSNYIDPRHMDADEWRFFAELIRWARANRDDLGEPLVFGGDPAEREAYGYAHLSAERRLYFARNPWIEETSVTLPEPEETLDRELRVLYPSPGVMARVAAGSPLPTVPLGPYELVVLEAVPTRRGPQAPVLREAPVEWRPDGSPTWQRTIFEPDPPAYGPSWSCPDGDAGSLLIIEGEAW